MRTAIADPMIGRVLEGRYRIQSRIARGGMSTVYAAMDVRLDRPVAIKLMAERMSADPAFMDRFGREARAAARLSHLNVVSVYDQGLDGGQPFLVMELVIGRTVRDLLHERGRLSPAEAVSIMEPVLAALSAAHRAGLVHRDVKPENILIADDGVVKVADFGLARAVETDLATTQTGLMMGTVAYCAPEQVARGRADQRTDVYSAGIVLFELLTGAPPFVGNSAMEVAYQHVHRRVPGPATRVRGIPPQLDALVLRATDPDPGGRPLDAGAFLAELHDVRADLGLPVVPVPPRPRTAPAGTQGTPTSPLGELQHDTRIAEPVGRPAPPPRQSRTPTQRGRRRMYIALIVLLILGLAVGYAGWWFASGRYSRVPDVSGAPKAAATATLSDAGFHVADRSQYSETVPVGRVIATDPGAGARKPRGQTITLLVSNGKERFTIPGDLRGKAPSAAHAALAQFPLQIKERQQADAAVPAGQVVGTDPAAGTQVRRDATVTILVSSGPPLVQVPDVGNSDQDAATNALTNAGFKVATVQAFSDQVPAGQVISQDPSGGSQVAKSSTVTLTVSKGPELVQVPAIDSGTSLADARQTLRQAGLQVQVQKSYGGHLGLVVGMDPPAGTSVKRGTTITLYVV